jgi:hypothetical protein
VGENRAKLEKMIGQELIHKMISFAQENELLNQNYALSFLPCQVIDDGFENGYPRFNVEYRMEVNVFQTLSPEDIEYILGRVALETGYPHYEVMEIMEALTRYLDPTKTEEVTKNEMPRL